MSDFDTAQIALYKRIAELAQVGATSFRDTPDSLFAPMVQAYRDFCAAVGWRYLGTSQCLARGMEYRMIAVGQGTDKDVFYSGDIFHYDYERKGWTELGYGTLGATEWDEMRAGFRAYAANHARIRGNA
jgi:hypothetical protein